MKRFRRSLLGGLLLISFCFANDIQVDAKLKNYPPGVHSVVDYPGIHLVDPITRLTDSNYAINEEYSTLIRPSKNLTFTSKGARDDVKNAPLDGKVDNVFFWGTDIVNSPNSPHYMQLNKAGIYKGDYMDVRIHFKAIESPGNESGRRIRFSLRTRESSSTGGFLQMDFVGGPNNGQAYIVVEFLKSGTNTPLDYKGTWNFNRLNYYKSIAVSNNPERTEDVFAYKYNRPPQYSYGVASDYVKQPYHYMYYEPRNQFEGVPFTKMAIPNSLIEDGNSYMQFYGANKNNGDFRENMSVSFNAINGQFPFVVSLINNKDIGYLKYESEPITRMELPTPQVVGLESEKKHFKFTVSQDMPKQAMDSFYPKDYQLEIDLKAEIEPLKATDYTITDLNDVDAKNKFQAPVLSADGTKLIFKIKDPYTTLKDPSFVDNAYNITVDAKMKTDKDISGKSYKTYFNWVDVFNEETEQIETHGYYRLPIKAQYTTLETSGSRTSKPAETKSKMIAVPTVESAKTIQVEQGSSTSDWIERFKPEDLFNGIDSVKEAEQMYFYSIEPRTFNAKGKTQIEVILAGKETNIPHKDKTTKVNVEVLAKRKAYLHYVDSGGKEIAPTLTREGFETKPYDFQSDKKEFPSYNFVKVDEVKGDKVTGTYPAEDRDLHIYYTYESKKFDVTAKYIDRNGDPIASEVVTSYEANNAYDVTAKQIPGYTLKSVIIDNKNGVLDSNGAVKVPVKDKPMTVEFKYDASQMSVLLNVNKVTATQLDHLIYTLEIKSGLKSSDDFYKNFKGIVTLCPNLIDFKKVDLLDSTGKKVGHGDYNEQNHQLTLVLDEQVKVSEDLKVTFEGTIKEDAKTNDQVEVSSIVNADYQVNGANKTISTPSNRVHTTIEGGLRLVSAPDSIDFGDISRNAKEQIVGNPTFDHKLVISDTRTESGEGWTLYASLAVPLNSDGVPLEGDVLYRNGKSEIELSSANQVILSQKDDNNAYVDVTSRWGTSPTSDGIKLKFKASDMPKTGHYQGKIRWTLSTGMP